MAADLNAPPDPGTTTPGEPGLASALKGIVDDALDLLHQQFAMLKAEVRADVRKALAGVIPLASGVAPLLLGGLMLCFALVHLIHWSTLPAGADPATIPLWASYAIVGVAFLLLGGILLAVGIFRLKAVHLLPEQTAEAFEENVKWLMNKHPK